MSTFSNFGLNGVNSTLRFGKGGNRLENISSGLRVLQPTGSTRASLEAANLDLTGTLNVTGASTFNGTVTATSGVQILADSGTAANPGVSFAGAGNNVHGMALVSGQVVLSVSGASAVTLSNPALTTGSVAVFGGNRSITLPVGTTAERPSSPVAGMIRFNSTTSQIEFHDGTNWVSSSSSAFTSFVLAASGGSASGGPVNTTNPTETMNLTAGNGIGLVGNNTTKTITISLVENGFATPGSVAGTNRVAFFTGTSPGTASVATFNTVFNDLDVPYGITANGLITRTAPDTYTSRSIAASTAAGLLGLSVTNGDGVAGNPTVGLDIIGLTNKTTPIVGADSFLLYDSSTNTNVRVAASSIASFVSTSSDPLVRRAAAISVTDLTNIGSALPTPSSGNVYITRVIINVTAAASGGAGGIITDGTNIVVAASEWDWNTVGIYIIDLPLSFSSTGAQLQFSFTTAPTTAGTATVTAEYKIA